MPKKSLRLLAVTVLLSSLVLVAWENSAGWNIAHAEAFADPAFAKLWNVTDKPVAEGAASRSFLWGPEGFATQTERYDNSPGGQRLVQYFDKGRMELTNPKGDPESAWYVGSGLLVRDLAGGIVQVGDNNVQIFEPAGVPVAGDSSVEANKNAPTYADFSREVFSRGTNSRVGLTIRDTIRAGGRTGTRDSKAEPAVKYAYYVQQSNHNIPAPFWNYFQQRGLVYPSKGGTATASLFDWQYLMGYPVTEAYWTTVKIGGKDTETLVQLYERRVLTFTPTNPEGFQVEMGNVGRHYYQWRYGPAPAIAQDTSVPESTGGTVYPKTGNGNTIFHFTVTGYQPGEQVYPILTQPGGLVLKSRFPVKASPTGVLAFGLYGFDFAARENNGLGVYSFSFEGEKTKKDVMLYVRIIVIPPITPTTPYKVETSVPPSVNAIPEPAYGHIFTDFIALLYNFYTKDFALGRVAIWVNDPFGSVFAISDGGLGLVNETLEGAIIEIGGLPEPGIWAITFQDVTNPAKKSIVYLRGTEEPPEVTIGAALNILTFRSTTGLLNQALVDPFGVRVDNSNQSQN